MKGFKIGALTSMLVIGASNVAMAMEKVHHNPAHSGPAWLASFAAICGTILAIASITLIWMMVSGKAGKFSE